jgi:prepilin-type N-terminal cleavage/methylation domain-containing protein
MRYIEPGEELGDLGFTLVELICVCALISILLAVVTPTIGRQILLSRVAAENATLQNFAVAAQGSFESTDLEGTNLAALAGTVPTGVDATNYSTSTNPVLLPTTTNTFDWFAKLARQMGSAPQVGIAPAPALQPQLAGILINPEQNIRIFLLGPTNETNQQRFLLVSLMAPSGMLALPAWPNPANPQDSANLALFNEIWNTNWTASAAVLPPTWTAALTSDQIQAWQGSASGGSRLWLLCVQRIVCPKFTLTVNNTHPTDSCYVFYNLNGTVAGATATVPANGGVYVVPGILGGRLIQAYRGTSGPPIAPLFAQFILRDSSEITLQD